jgi:hypothetical protein
MERRWMRPGRVVVLAMVGIAAGLVAVSRTSSSAQEPAKPSAREALRQRIADLRGDVALRELEHEVAREALKQRLMNPPTLPEALQGLREGLDKLIVFGTDKLFDAAAKAEMLEGFKKDGVDEIPLEQLSKALDEAVKTKDYNTAYRATREWLSGAEDWSKARLDAELIKGKKDFAIQASALWLKKLELEDLERQYRESR